MSAYIVDVICPRCGQTHRLANSLLLDRGPTASGSLTALYGEGELPWPLATLLEDLVWCDEAAAWVQQQERDRVFLAPRLGP